MGGLFDAQGRLVGITTMYLKDAQALNFAVPAELIASVPKTDPAVQSAAKRAEPEPKPKWKDRWWTYYDDDEVKIAFDTETVRRDGHNVTIWQQATYAKLQRLESGSYIERISRDTYYCGSRQSSFDQIITRDAAGKVVGSSRLESWEMKRRDVVPGTIGEASYEAACSL